MEQTINVNTIPGAVGEVLCYSQYDVGRTAIVKLQSGTESYTIPTGSTVRLKATKPSGLGFDVQCTFSGNQVTFTSTDTMTNESGRFPAELEITNGTTVLGTANFTMYVEPSPHLNGVHDGDKEEILNELELYVNNLVDTEMDGKVDEIVAELEPMIPTKTSDLTNDSGFITDVPHAANSVYGTVKVSPNGDPPAGYIKLTYGNDRDIYAPYLYSTSDTIRPKFLPDATASSKGAVKVDSTMSSTSANPVQNSTIYAELEAIKQAIRDLGGNI